METEIHIVSATFSNNIKECSPGYYKVEDHSRCDLCPRNTIKISAGNRLNCSIDQACDGVTNVPSSDHSKCGK